MTQETKETTEGTKVFLADFSFMAPLPPLFAKQDVQMNVLANSVEQVTSIIEANYGANDAFKWRGITEQAMPEEVKDAIVDGELTAPPTKSQLN